MNSMNVLRQVPFRGLGQLLVSPFEAERLNVSGQKNYPMLTEYYLMPIQNITFAGLSEDHDRIITYYNHCHLAITSTYCVLQKTVYPQYHLVPIGITSCGYDKIRWAFVFGLVAYGRSLFKDPGKVVV